MARPDIESIKTMLMTCGAIHPCADRRFTHYSLWDLDKLATTVSEWFASQAPNTAADRGEGGDQA